MRAMVVKEFNQLRRDRRTLAMMIFLPVLLLIVFGYAASFDVKRIPVVVVGPRAGPVADELRAPFAVVERDPGAGRVLAEQRLRDGDAAAAILTGMRPPLVLLDGSQLFSARAAEAALAQQTQPGVAIGKQARASRVQVLFNPSLRTSAVLVSGIAGLILLFIVTVTTSLGVVRERQAGTLEQLAVMPLSPWDVIVGKIVPYFLVGVLDLVATVVLAVVVFSVPFNGSVATLALGGLLFLLVTTGMGVLISTVSQNQGQAIQLAIMTLLPQILLSGLIFPVSSMAAGVRWIAYLLPLKYFIDITRGVMLRGAPITSLWVPLLMLGVLGGAVLGLAVLRFRRDLAPAVHHHGPRAAAAS